MARPGNQIIASDANMLRGLVLDSRDLFSEDKYDKYLKDSAKTPAMLRPEIDPKAFSYYAVFKQNKVFFMLWKMFNELHV